MAKRNNPGAKKLMCINMYYDLLKDSEKYNPGYATSKPSFFEPAKERFLLVTHEKTTHYP